MKTIIFVALLICAPLTCHAARNQAECPPDTLWNSSNNECYPDPNAPSVIKARQEEEKARLEAERVKDEQQRKMYDPNDPNWKNRPNPNAPNVPNVIVNPY